MRQGENNVGLVDFGTVFQFVGHPGVAYHQKASEIMLVGFNTFLQDFHAVKLGCIFGADGCMSFQLFFVDVFGTSGIYP